MMATPEEVANDLSAWARNLERRDGFLAKVCRDTAVLISRMAVGQWIDGRTYYGLQKRLHNQVFIRRQEDSAIERSLSRGLKTLEDLRRAAVQGTGRSHVEPLS
jgi:hypothetical protein